MTGGLGPGYAEFSGPQTYFSLYGTYKFNDKWQSVTQWDSGWQDNFDGLDENHTAVYYSFTQYLFYTINPRWTLGTATTCSSTNRATCSAACPRQSPAVALGKQGRSTPSAWG